MVADESHFGGNKKEKVAEVQVENNRVWHPGTRRQGFGPDCEKRII